MMKNKLLIISPGSIPTIEIITRSLLCMPSSWQIKLVVENQLNIKDIFSGEYQLLFIRQCSPALQPLLTLMNQFRIRYLYYLDDNFWEMKGNTPLANYHQNKEVLKTLTAFVSSAYCVITGSDNLKNYVLRYNANTIHIKAAFCFNLIEGLKQNPPSDIIKIIYSGSLYRDKDFEPVIPALIQIAQEYEGKINFYFNGFTPSSLKQLKAFIFNEGFCNYDDYIKKQYKDGYAIGLAPLVNSLSNKAKSNVKYREYGACRIAGIFTNQPPYSECINHGHNGLLVEQTSVEWYTALKTLIENRDLRQTIAKNAFKDIRHHYTHEQIAPKWEKIIVSMPCNLNQLKRLRLHNYRLKFKSFVISLHYKCKQVMNYYRYYGLIYTSKKIIRNLFHGR